MTVLLVLSMFVNLPPRLMLLSMAVPRLPLFGLRATTADRTVAAREVLAAIHPRAVLPTEGNGAASEVFPT